MYSNSSRSDSLSFEAVLEYGLVLAFVAAVVLLLGAPMTLQLYHVVQTIATALDHAVRSHG